MVDAESGLEREVDLPAARRFSLSGWASVGATRPTRRSTAWWGCRHLALRLLQPLRGPARAPRVLGLRRATRAPPGSATFPRVGRASIEWSGPRSVSVREACACAPGRAEFAVARPGAGLGGRRPRPGRRREPGGQPSSSAARCAAARFRVEITAVRRSAEAPAARARRRRRERDRPPRASGRRRSGAAGRFATRCGELRASARPGGSAADARSAARSPRSTPAGPWRWRAAARLSSLGEGRARVSVPAGERHARRPPGTALARAEPGGPRHFHRAGWTSVDGGGPGAPRERAAGAHRPVLDRAHPELQPRLARHVPRRARARAIPGRARARSTATPTAGAPGATAGEVSFAFAPQSTANAGFALSALAALVLLVVALWPAPQAAPPPPADAGAERAGPGQPTPLRRLGWRVALPAALLAGGGGRVCCSLCAWAR